MKVKQSHVTCWRVSASRRYLSRRAAHARSRGADERRSCPVFGSWSLFLRVDTRFLESEGGAGTPHLGAAG